MAMIGDFGLAAGITQLTVVRVSPLPPKKERTAVLQATVLKPPPVKGVP